MPHIFRFHAGRNNNIYDWTLSDRIQPTDVRDVMDRTNIMTSSAGTSIPTPVARMFLFKTAYEIVAAQVRDNKLDEKSIYAGLVSETLDLLELLYKRGADESKFRYDKWTFDNSQKDDNVILSYFGNQHGHRLLAESFKQAASQEPFNNKIEVTLIYYKEGNNEILIGGTSPFTFVFTSPNFKRKMRERGFKSIQGLVSNDILFDSDYKQLHERDESFIKYVESLATTEGIGRSFAGFSEYVINTRNRHHIKFNGLLPSLHDIQFKDNPIAVTNINLKQLSEDDAQNNIEKHSDFKIALPEDSSYDKIRKPLFLLDKMSYDGQYSSTSRMWTSTTRVSENSYPETKIDDIYLRELPELDIKYPFFSSFDFFEANIIMLPGYELNDERFICLSNNQTYIYPIKPIFFHLFPVHRIKDYVSIESKGDSITVILKIPVFGPTKSNRDFVCRKTYDADTIINYSGILGIFPFTKASSPNLLHLNKYTVASYEKTNESIVLDSIIFIKKSGTDFISTAPILRSDYADLNTKSVYYQLDQSFDMIQLNFRKDNILCGGLIIPKFIDVDNGTESYVYAIDFGTSNTHVEYGRIIDDRVVETHPFSIDEKGMQMYLLNKPKQVVLNDGAIRYNDYERSMGYKIDSARTITLREFLPFQIGSEDSASTKFPFRTATCESNAFISDLSKNRLFIDANIGFNIDADAVLDNIRYTTDLKWLLQKDITNKLHINRISIFFRELLLMIRTKVLIEENNKRGNLDKLTLALSFPLSMGSTLRSKIIDIFEIQRRDILGPNSLPVKRVTESIAPYYHIKFKNINVQNDSYCNIDIGGGTTDIVLIDKNHDNQNELLCYCSSFKFAGKQLWGSGNTEFNMLANGFVTYYKKFIEEKDKDVYNELQRLLNNNTTRTEDIVGLLFSKPQYRFAEIFDACSNLKVVPLIHYSAILYYLTKLAHFKNVDLPRTISFSGKGSEYLSLIFPSDKDLQGFTIKVLELFSSKQVHSQFQVIRKNEPKVITAKGAVHRAVEPEKSEKDDWNVNRQHTDEKMVNEIELNFNGFENLDMEGQVITYSQLSANNELFLSLMNSHTNFFNSLFDDKVLCDLINKKLEIKDFAKYKSFFIPSNGNIKNEGSLRDSFKATLSNLDPTETVADPPFFYALNYSLIELSREIVDEEFSKN